MRHRFSGRVLLTIAIVLTAAGVYGQGRRLPVRTPRDFTELRGTWVLDENAGTGHIAGLPVAHALSISTTPFEISLVKDGRDPEVYSLDGREIAAKDAKTGAVLELLAPCIAPVLLPIYLVVRARADCAWDRI